MTWNHQWKTQVEASTSRDASTDTKRAYEEMLAWEGTLYQQAQQALEAYNLLRDEPPPATQAAVRQYGEQSQPLDARHDSLSIFVYLCMAFSVGVLLYTLASHQVALLVCLGVLIVTAVASIYDDLLLRRRRALRKRLRERIQRDFADAARAAVVLGVVDLDQMRLIFTPTGVAIHFAVKTPEALRREAHERWRQAQEAQHAQRAHTSTVIPLPPPAGS